MATRTLPPAVMSKPARLPAGNGTEAGYHACGSLRVTVQLPLFYGAFTAKVLLVRSRRLPGRALPAAGGTLAVIVGVLWSTSALWYHNGYQLPHLKAAKLRGCASGAPEPGRTNGPW